MATAEELLMGMAQGLTPEEIDAMSTIKGRLPVFENHRQLLDYVRETGVKWSGKGAEKLCSFLEEIYSSELQQGNGDLEGFIEGLNTSVDDFAASVSEFLGKDQEIVAESTRRNIFFKAITSINLDAIAYEKEMHKQAASGEYDVSKVEDYSKLLDYAEKLAKKAGIKENPVDGNRQILVRYAILSAADIIANEEDIDDVLKDEAYTSLSLAKRVLPKLEDEDIYQGLKANISSLEKSLETRLGIDTKKVSELLEKEETSEEEKQRDRFLKQYRRKAKALSKKNEAFGERVYERTDNFAERYRLIVSMFKEAMLYEAVGDYEKAVEVSNDINDEFEVFTNLMDDPRILLTHYTNFREFCSVLDLPLEDDHTEMMKEKIEKYQTAKNQERERGWLNRLRNAFDDNRPEAFITGETLENVMVEYQNRFRKDQVKTEIMISESGIKERENMEAIVGAYLTGLMLAESERRMIEIFGLQEGETYRHDGVLVTNEDFVNKVTELEAQIRETGMELINERNDEKADRLGERLKTLQHALHQLKGNAIGIDEEDIPEYEKRVAENRYSGNEVVQIRTTLTERDIGREGLLKDTFIQYVTKSLAGRGIVPALDHRTRREGKTGYQVDRAWEEIKAALPVFENIEEDIPQLADTVGRAFGEEAHPHVLIQGVVDRHFQDYKGRSAVQRIKDTLTHGVNRMGLLRERYNR